MLVINGKYRIHFSSFFSSMKNLGATFLGGLWWTWHPDEFTVLGGLWAQAVWATCGR